MTGGASKKSKNGALTTATLINCVASPVPTASVFNEYAAFCEKAVDHRVRSP
jgi:hypothetical protein